MHDAGSGMSEERRAPSAMLLAGIERNRRRIWGLCYRMTGLRADADDLSQEAIARAIEREEQVRGAETMDGWLLRIATTMCLDHIRRRQGARRANELVDPVEGGEPFRADAATGPEAALILREDLRLAVTVALQALPPRQRAALILWEVFDRPLAEVATTLGTNPNAAKALVARARDTLARARRRVDVDVPADPAVVDRLVQAIELRSVEAFTALLDEDVWGVVDGGGIVRTARKPTFGVRAVSRQWANGNRRLAMPLAAHAHRVNGEAAVLVTLPEAGSAVIASIHVETRHGRIAALRVIRDPRKLASLQPLAHDPESGPWPS